RIATGITEVAAHVAKMPGVDPLSATAPASEPAFWLAALDRQCRTLLDELAFLVPWSALPTAPEGSSDLLDILCIPTLRALDEPVPSARVVGAIAESRGARAGTAAAGELVRARAGSDVVGGPANPLVVERFDVRVPDAAPRDAHLREHPARSDGSRLARAPDR